MTNDFDVPPFDVPPFDVPPFDVPPFDVMVLCAGLGTRLRPLTNEVAKPAVPFFGRALATWTFDRLVALGARAITINTHWLPDTMTAPAREHADRLRIPLNVSHEPLLLGTGGGLWQARERFGIGRDRPLLILNGDVLYDLDLAAVLDTHARTNAAATMVLRDLPPGATYSRLGLDASDRILRIAKFAAPDTSAVVREAMFSGVHVLSPRALDLLPPGESSVIEKAYKPLLDAGEHVQGIFANGTWLDLGDPGGYLDAHRAFLDGTLDAESKAFPGLSDAVEHAVHPGAKVDPAATLVRTVVGSGAEIGAGATLTDCVVWPGARLEAGETITRTVVAKTARARG